MFYYLNERNDMDVEELAKIVYDINENVSFLIEKVGELEDKLEQLMPTVS